MRCRNEYPAKTPHCQLVPHHVRTLFSVSTLSVLLAITGAAHADQGLVELAQLRGPKPLPVAHRGLAIAGTSRLRAFVLAGDEILAVDVNSGGPLESYPLPDDVYASYGARMYSTDAAGSEFLIVEASRTVVYVVSPNGTPHLLYIADDCGHVRFGRRLELLPDGQRMLAMGDKCVNLIDIATGSVIETLAPTGSFQSGFIGGSKHRAVIAIQAREWNPQRTVTQWWAVPEDGPPESLTVDTEDFDTYLYWIDRDGTLAIRAGRSGFELRRIADHASLGSYFPRPGAGQIRLVWSNGANGPVLIAFHSSGTDVTSFADPGAPSVTASIEAGPHARTKDGYRELVDDVQPWSLSADGREIAFADPDRHRVVRLDVSTGQIVAEQEISPSIPVSISLSERPDASKLALVWSRHWLEYGTPVAVPGGGARLTVLDWTSSPPRTLTAVAPIGIEYAGSVASWDQRFVATSDRYQNSILVFDLTTQQVMASGGLAVLPYFGWQLHGAGRWLLASVGQRCELLAIDGERLVTRGACTHDDKGQGGIQAVWLRPSGVALLAWPDGIEQLSTDGTSVFFPFQWVREEGEPLRAEFGPDGRSLLVAAETGIRKLALTMVSLDAMQPPRLIWQRVVDGRWARWVDGGRRVFVVGSDDFALPSYGSLLDAATGTGLGPPNTELPSAPRPLPAVALGIGTQARVVFSGVVDRSVRTILVDVSGTTPRQIASYDTRPFRPVFEASPYGRVWYELLHDDSEAPQVMRGRPSGKRELIGTASVYDLTLVAPGLLVGASRLDFSALVLLGDFSDVSARSPRQTYQKELTP